MSGFHYTDPHNGECVWFQTDGLVTEMHTYPDESALLADHPGSTPVNYLRAQEILS